jgi:hypothetical protein
MSKQGWIHKHSQVEAGSPCRIPVLANQVSWRQPWCLSCVHPPCAQSRCCRSGIGMLEGHPSPAASITCSSTQSLPGLQLHGPLTAEIVKHASHTKNLTGSCSVCTCYRTGRVHPLQAARVAARTLLASMQCPVPGLLNALVQCFETSHLHHAHKAHSSGPH